MPLPLPPPDLVELGEYLATHILLEIESGLYSDEDLKDSPRLAASNRWPAKRGVVTLAPRCRLPSRTCSQEPKRLGA